MGPGWRRALVALGACAACGRRGTAVPPPASDDLLGGDAAVACGAGTAARDGGACDDAGIPADACGDGFVTDGQGGCSPVLPDARCPDGQVAWLGETVCHDLVDCGDGAWGDVPVDAATVYVDTAYAGGGSDGSRDHPWTRIGDGVTHAGAGALVAIAAGTYAEVVQVHDKPVRLWGRCPRLVSVACEACVAPTAGGLVNLDAAGAELHGIAIDGRGLRNALAVGDVAVDDLWIHDTSAALINLASSAADGWSLFHAQRLLIARSRNGIPTAAGTLENVTVLDTAGDDPIFVRSMRITNALRATNLVVDGSTGTGISVEGQGVLVGDGVVVRNTLDLGIAASNTSAATTTLRLTHAVVTSTASAALFVEGTSGVLDTVTVAGVNASSDGAGYGVYVAAERTGAQTVLESTLTLHRARITGATSAAIVVVGATAAIDGVRVDGVRVDSRGVAFGVVAEDGAHLDLRSASIDDARYAGVAFLDSSGRVEGTRIRGVRARNDGTLGDAISLSATGADATLDLAGCTLEGSARAGFSNFGGYVTIAGSTFVDDALDFDGETQGGRAARFTDVGGNTCLSGGAAHPCVVQSAGLSPPDAAP